MRKILSSLLLLFSFAGYAQIIDDSTELVYGPETTKFIYESQILNNQVEYLTVDTSLYLFERQSFIDRNERKYQNLGNFGTALFPVFHTPQQSIGRTSGFNAYAPYATPRLTALKFYDTKSPFIDLFTYLGGGNKNFVRVDFSRNVREGWNVGFNLHKITTDKLLANNGEGDRQTVNTNFDIYTHYLNTKVPYQAVVYLSRLSHNVFELGGTRYGSDSTLTELFRFDNALLRLSEAQNTRTETQWHWYHDFSIADQLQVYHTFHYQGEENTYQDFTDGSSGEYDTYADAYGVFLLDSDSTYERSTFSSTTNEAGIKGDLESIFYRAYIKLRSVDFSYALFDPVEKVTETYIGGYTRFNWKDKFRVIAETEVLQGGEYQFKGNLSSDLVNLTYESKKFNVPFIYNNYFGNHHFWRNNFTPIFSNQLSGNLNLKYKFISLIPKINFTTYNDFVYFDEFQNPQQASSGMAISSIGGAVNIALKSRNKDEGFYFENEVIATDVSGGAANAVRIPELFYNGRYYWRGLLFGDQIPIEFGLDTHARSSYFANAYSPELQQFYLQNELEQVGYFKADLFFNMRLDKFYLGVKWAHLDQPADSGYFVTPFYPGQPRAIDLIIRWTFFD